MTITEKYKYYHNLAKFTRINKKINYSNDDRLNIYCVIITISYIFRPDAFFVCSHNID